MTYFIVLPQKFFLYISLSALLIVILFLFQLCSVHRCVIYPPSTGTLLVNAQTNIYIVFKKKFYSKNNLKAGKRFEGPRPVI